MAINQKKLKNYQIYFNFEGKLKKPINKMIMIIKKKKKKNFKILQVIIKRGMMYLKIFLKDLKLSSLTITMDKK